MARPRGASLQLVLVLVTIMSLLAATMTAVYTMGLNFAQSFSNDQGAHDEAQTGLGECLARLVANPAFGQAGEEIRGTTIPDLDSTQAYHVVTFKNNLEFARSTNNPPSGANSAGALGKTVPPGAVHVISTGYCRGRYCCLEALVLQPPFPYGLAASGPIVSKDPLIVRGTTSVGLVGPPPTDVRPGHIVCNSSDGVKIGPPVGTQPSTYISGFIKSVGPIDIQDNGADVRGGLLAFSDATTLPSFTLTDFRNKGQDGVSEMLDSAYGACNLDIMYYGGHDLRFDGTVTLKNAFVYVDGNVLITGGLKGKGAIVVNGDLTVNGGAELQGTNQLALLASGTINLQGDGNYLQGIVWSNTGLKAKNITVVGSAIVNTVGGPSLTGGVELERVAIISDDTVNALKFQASSGSGDLKTDAQPIPPCPTMTDYHLDALGVGDPAGGDPNGAGALPADWPADAFKAVAEAAVKVCEAEAKVGLANVAVQAAQAQMAAAQTSTKYVGIDANGAPVYISPDPQQVSAAQVAVQAANAQLAAAQNEFTAALADWKAAASTARDAYAAFVKVHTAVDGNYGTTHEGDPLTVHHDFDFSLNSYLPPSGYYRLGYCRSFGYKL